MATATKNNSNPETHLGEKSMKILQIFEYESFKKQIHNTRPEGPINWIFLGYSFAIQQELREQMLRGDREIVLHDDIEASARELRQQFIDYVASVTHDDGRKENLYSGFAERIPFRSNIFLDICLIDTAIRKIRSLDIDPVIVICEHRGLAYDFFRSVSEITEIKAAVHVQGPVFSLADKIASMVNVILHSGKISAQLLFRHGRAGNPDRLRCREQEVNGIIVLHSWVAPSSIESGVYKEMFFSDLQEKLTDLGYTVLLLPHVPYDIRFSGTVDALRKRQARFVMEEEFLTVTGIIRIFFTTAGNFPRWSEHHLGGIHFSHSVYMQSFRDWQNLQLLVPRVCEEVIKGLSGENMPIRTFIYTYENNAWEKAFLKNLRRFFPGTTSIGYQHSTVTPNYLYHYLSRSPMDQRYVPDLVITSGNYPARFLRNNNYPEGRVLAGGALRYELFTKDLPVRTHVVPHNNRVLVALPIIIDESVEILGKILEATGDIPGIEVLVKLHPFLSQANLEKCLSAGLAKKIRFTPGTLREILPEVNVLVYSTTSSCIEALSFGIPVLKIRSERRLDMDPLGDFQGTSRFISAATQPNDIREELLRMSALEMTSTEREEIQGIIRDIFGKVDDGTYQLFTRLKSRE